MAVLNTDRLIANYSAAELPAEHGVGAIGTNGPPKTYRRTEGGVIITQIILDITGLASLNAAGDVIGVGVSGAYIGRNDVSKNGVIFKTLFTCLETPATGDDEIDLGVMPSPDIALGVDGGADLMSSSGTLLIGQSVVNLIPTIPSGYYYYLLGANGDTDGTYTAGQYIFTTWGHPLLDA